MPTIQCFWLEPTGCTRRWLRRYVSGQHCPAHPNLHSGQDYSYHDVKRLLDEVDGSVPSGDTWPHDDPRWPATCDCGYVFTEGDTWQLFAWSLYCRTDTGEILPLGDAPPGAMWDATWYAPARPRPDGIHLIVQTPAGEWDVDSVASNGPGWERTGAPPNVTATPSIGIGEPMRYHGWLRDGYLVEA